MKMSEGRESRRHVAAFHGGRARTCGEEDAASGRKWVRCGRCAAAREKLEAGFGTPEPLPSLKVFLYLPFASFYLP